MNSPGRNDLVVAAAPAQQRLDRSRALPAEAHLRLVMQHEVASVDGFAQGLLDAEPVRGLHQHRRLVDAKTVAPKLLGAEQRHVGRAQERRRVAAMLRKHRNATAHADRYLASLDQQRPLEPRDQLCGAALDLRGIAGVREYQRELVTAEPRREAGFARYLAQAFADLDQHAVTEIVAQRIVDGLEVIQVEEQHGDLRCRRVCGTGGVEHFVQSLEQLTPVRQVGQWIVIREVPQLQRPFLDAVLELRLVGLDGALRVRQFRGHVIERVGQFVDLAGAAARDARRKVAGGQAASADRQPAHGPRNRPCRGEQCEQGKQYRLVRRIP